jgi:tetratricopeptide (TPR) repeat protein
MSVKIFLSTVSDEFRLYRDQLRTDLTRHNVEVKVQEDFKDLGRGTLDELDTYIANGDAVVHLVGHMTGAYPDERDVGALVAKYSTLASNLPSLGEALKNGRGISYTQWEAWLALYHCKDLFITQAAESAVRGPRYAPTDGSRAAQTEHLQRLRELKRYPGFTFTGPIDLANYLKSTGILDLLVKAYAEESARARDVAEGFIDEMAKKIAGDRNLDFEGKKQAVRNAIDIYEKEIGGGQTQTNIDAIVDQALARARSLVDVGKSGLARATLRQAAEVMRREEEERRKQYIAGITALYDRARDIALAAYDGEAAAEAIVDLAEAIHGANTAMVVQSLNSQAATLYEYGRDRGSNVHLTALIALRRKLLDTASSDDELGIAHDNLGTALSSLGDRESGTARLEEAVAAYRRALEERTRERVPLDWATTQNNLGLALWRLGQRESRTARLEEAVSAFRGALEETRRDQAPRDWAMTQVNLGCALATLGERQSGTARHEEALVAFRAALEEINRDQTPRDWAMTQVNLGSVLSILGARESGTARLEEAVSAFRAALEETTRNRVPLDWGLTQVNLGNALVTLGDRESGTARLEEAVSAFRAALEERTRERVPLQWAMTQMNLGAALSKLGEHESGTARLEEAVLAFRAALEETTRERVPLQWAMTQMNLGAALETLGEREGAAARLEEAVEAYRAALEERTRDRVPLDWALTQMNLGNALSKLGECDSGTARLAAAVVAWNACLAVATSVWPPEWVRIVEARRDETQGEIVRRSAVHERWPKTSVNRDSPFDRV